MFKIKMGQINVLIMLTMLIPIQGWPNLSDQNVVVPESDLSSSLTANNVPDNVTALAAGWLHTCALTSYGVQCWGANFSGQLGDGAYSQRLFPTTVSGLGNNISAITAGGTHTCALTTSGGIKCWGGNGSGQIGDGSTSPRNTPVDVSGLTTGVIAVSAGGSHTCALITGGAVKCWGANDHGQLGDGTTTPRTTPVPVSGLTSGVIAIAAGGYHTCALTSSHGVKCWGWNYSGQVGDDTTVDHNTPVDVYGLTSGVAAVVPGGYHTCALTQSGGVKCWGNNYAGQLGTGNNTYSYRPIDVTGLTSGVSLLAVGSSFGSHNCAIVSGGGVKCWGLNSAGQIGDGTTTNRSLPTQVIGLSSGASNIIKGDVHVCALIGTDVKCWGGNNAGQIGDGTTTDRHLPVLVIGVDTTPIIREARLDIGMPYDTDRGCSSPYTGCGGPYHGFYDGVCTDLVLDAYNTGGPFNIQAALYQDYLANRGRYRWASARNADDMRRYFVSNQQFLPNNQAFKAGDIAFFDWDGDGITDHVLVIAAIDSNGRPLKMVDASGSYPGNPQGLAFEHNWSSYYDQHTQGHGRINGLSVAAVTPASSVLQVLDVSVDSPSVQLKLIDSNGKSTSDTFDENLIASNVESFIPYIPGGVYGVSGGQRVITVTQPLSNTSNYMIELTGQAASTYHLLVETRQNSLVTASELFTQSIGLNNTQNVSITVSAPGGSIQFAAASPALAPAPGVPNGFSLNARVNTTAQAIFAVNELGGQQALNGVVVTTTNLSDQLGGVLPKSNISIGPSDFTVNPGGIQTVTIHVDIANVPMGLYLGSLVVTSLNAGARTVPFAVTIQPYSVELPLIRDN